MHVRRSFVRPVVRSFVLCLVRYVCRSLFRTFVISLCLQFFSLVCVSICMQSVRCFFRALSRPWVRSLCLYVCVYFVMYVFVAFGRPLFIYVVRSCLLYIVRALRLQLFTFVVISVGLYLCYVGVCIIFVIAGVSYVLRDVVLYGVMYAVAPFCSYAWFVRPDVFRSLCSQSFRYVCNYVVRQFGKTQFRYCARQFASSLVMMLSISLCHRVCCLWLP